jgi:translation initiation factor 2B subunit (eIF-2B alpha/beta/delta family)
MGMGLRLRRLGNPSVALEVRLELLRNDHTSPSLTLAHRAIDLAEDWLESGAHPKRLARELSGMHPGVALIANLARMLEEDDPHLTQSLRMMRGSLQEGNQLIAEKLAELVSHHPIVITLSNSATVCDALAYVGCRVAYVLESRPGGEDARMVKGLRARLSRPEQPAEVHLMEATTIGNVVPHVDCAVVGADAISRSGAVLHKVGTLPLALCCRYFHKPFYALGHSLKQVDHEFGEPPQTNGVLETQIFDCTPAELLTRVVTERSTGLAASTTAGGAATRPRSRTAVS